MSSRTRSAVAFAAAILIGVVAATPSRAADIQLTPIVADVLWAPQPMRGSDARVHLVYELRLSNPTPFTLALETIEVVDETGRVLLTMDKDTIGQRFSIGGRRGNEATTLAVGQFGVLFTHAAVWQVNAVPGTPSATPFDLGTLPDVTRFSLRIQHP